MTTTVQVDLYAIMPERWGMCRTCEAFMAQAELSHSASQDNLGAYPPVWRQEFEQISRLIECMAHEYGDQVRLHIHDPRSPDGLVGLLRYGIRHYPAFVVAGKDRIISLEWEPLRKAIQLARGKA